MRRPSPKSAIAGGATRRWVVLALLGLYGGMLAWSAAVHSPVKDEVPALAAGIRHWQVGQFNLFRVNPPLVRMVAALPVLSLQPATDWSRLHDVVGRRPEFDVGEDFIRGNGERSFWLFTVARWACLPFSVLGAYICFRWARELYGFSSGITALILWCFSPSVVGHAPLITADAAAAALGMVAGYLFWRWLRNPTWSDAAIAGLALGLAELAKTTWIVLFLVWPTLWTAWNLSKRPLVPWDRWGRLTMILVLGICVINLGYGCEGSFHRLGDIRFISRALAGAVDYRDTAFAGGNRFSGSCWAWLPVPLPLSYVQGIDIQKRDFEAGYYSYLAGRWSGRGWWYYYLYALAIKVPLGTWILVVLALVLGLFGPGYAASWREELVLVAPIVVVLALVSSQTGFNHHMRYVLPIFPFAFVWASKVAKVFSSPPATRLRPLLAGLVVAALSGSVASSLWIYPHSLSYFNELVGGPRRGHEHLLDSNIDWGQDLLYLKQWDEAHPEAKPLKVAYSNSYPATLAGFSDERPPSGPEAYGGVPPAMVSVGPLPGWYAVSVNELRGRHRRYEYFLRFEPVATAGYSIYIYHITLEEANRVRRRLGLPELPAMESGASGARGMSHGGP